MLYDAFEAEEPRWPPGHLGVVGEAEEAPVRVAGVELYAPHVHRLLDCHPPVVVERPVVQIVGDGYLQEPGLLAVDYVPEALLGAHVVAVPPEPHLAEEPVGVQAGPPPGRPVPQQGLVSEPAEDVPALHYPHPLLLRLQGVVAPVGVAVAGELVALGHYLFYGFRVPLRRQAGDAEGAFDLVLV